jgi:hypothetical protein
MYIPLLHERVRMLAHSGEFFVLRADYFTRRADLKPVRGGGQVLYDIPFASLFATWEEPSAEPESRCAVKAPSARGKLPPPLPDPDVRHQSAHS